MTDDTSRCVDVLSVWNLMLRFSSLHSVRDIGDFILSKLLEECDIIFMHRVFKKNNHKENVRLVTEFKTPFWWNIERGVRLFLQQNICNKSPINKIYPKWKKPRNIQVATNLNDFEFQVKPRSVMFFHIGTSVSNTCNNVTA